MLAYQKLSIIAVIMLVFMSGCNTIELTDNVTSTTIATPVNEALATSTTLSVTNIMPTATPIVPTPTTTSSSTTTPPLPTPTFTPTSTILPTPTITPDASVDEAWQAYHNTEYGFSFRYPDQLWTLIEWPDDENLLSLTYKEMGIVLRIRFNQLGQEAGLLLSGGAAGDFVSRGTVSFLDEEVEKAVLVFRGVDKEVHYDEAHEIQRGDLVFTIALVSNRIYEEAVVPEVVQAEADQVLGTFELIE